MKGNVLILGGNSDIGKAIGEKFSVEGYSLTLAVRHPTAENQIKFDAVEFDTHSSFIANLDVLPDVVVVAFGVLPDSQSCFDHPQEAVESTMVNYTGVVSIVGELSKQMVERGSGTIIGISSVAGDRGRRSNYVYGSSKAGVTTYFDGLRHYLLEKGVHVLVVKPGYVRTKMTASMSLPKLLTASPEQVANAIYKGFQSRDSTIYVLPIWRLIMWLIRLIPNPLFGRLNL